MAVFYASCALSSSWERLMRLHAQTSPLEADDRGFEQKATILAVGELECSVAPYA